MAFLSLAGLLNGDAPQKSSHVIPSFGDFTCTHGFTYIDVDDSEIQRKPLVWTQTFVYDQLE